MQTPKMSLVAVLLLVLLCAVSHVSAKSVLVLAADGDGTSAALTNDYARFWSILRERGHAVEFGTVNDRELLKFGELAADNLVLVAGPGFTKWGKRVARQAVLDYVNAGGNLLVLTDAATAPMIDLASSFGVKLTGTRATDFYHHHNADRTIVALQPSVTTPVHHVVGGGKKRHPVLYSGLVHSLVRSNSLVHTVLHGNPTTIGADSAASDGPSTLSSQRAAGKVTLGSATSLVSVLQARNNARVAIAGSTQLFADSLLSAEDSGNVDFVSDLSRWVFQEKSVLRTKQVRHHKVSQKHAPEYYRVGDEFVYEIELEQLDAGGKRWVPFTLPAGDRLQLEVVMLDPYLRVDLVPSNSSSNAAGRYTTKSGVRVPDQHGVYSFKVNYHRRGLSFVTEKLLVSVRPFRHNEYPRFLTAAYPYYAGAWSMIAAFLLFSVVFLYTTDSPVASKTD